MIKQCWIFGQARSLPPACQVLANRIASGDENLLAKAEAIRDLGDDNQLHITAWIYMSHAYTTERHPAISRGLSEFTSDTTGRHPPHNASRSDAKLPFARHR